MTDTLPDGYMVHLPAIKHRFDPHVWIPAGKSCSGYAQTERTCSLCGAVKVTIHGMPGGLTGRAWRVSSDAEQIETFDAPVCVPKVGGPAA